MNVAILDLPDDLIVPHDVCRAAYFDEITLRSCSAQIDHEAVWLSCADAWPHIDAIFEGQLFLTLTVAGDHLLGDAIAGPDHSVRPGTLSVIDPMVTHWLAPRWHMLDGRVQRQPWCGIQWTVDREDAPTKAAALVTKFGGAWWAEIDARYEAWAQPETLN